MKKIKKVIIEGFWGEKTVTLNFSDDVNFLIGVNGSGKTTIINLIAATLNADFTTLDKGLFSKIRIEFYSEKRKNSDDVYIEVEKQEKQTFPYPNVVFKIKLPNENKAKTYKLNEIEEEVLFRHSTEYIRHNFRMSNGGESGRDINFALKSIVSITWLSIHRSNRSFNRINDEKSFESTIDNKINDISTNLIKYFGSLDKKYSLETEKFQKNIFLSLLEDAKEDSLTRTDDLDTVKEKESLKQIFLLFKLKENEFADKLDKHFKSYEDAKHEYLTKQSIDIKELSYIMGTWRIHSIVQEWILLNETKNNINKPKTTFIKEVNGLLKGKEIYINEKNELLIRMAEKSFLLNSLSSGEKQLLIILGEGLLQENNNHIYIADEPELSLHVDWQEKLVSSLKNINPNSQIIFATHSPDIVGEFSDSVIDVENVIV